MQSLDKLREALGLSAADSVVEDSRLDAPVTGVGHGLVGAAEEAELSQQTIHAILVQPNFTPDLELGRRLGIDSVARWDGDSRLVVLGDVPVVARAGAAELVPELGWLVDTRGNNAAIIIGTSSREARYLSAENGRIALGHIEYGARSSSSFQFHDVPRFDLPDLASLANSIGIKRWLRDEIAQRSESESVLVRAAAVGLTGRLAMCDLEEPDLVFASIMNGGMDPLDLLRAWAAALPREVVAYLEASALDEAGVLVDQIDELERLVSGDHSMAARSALSARLRRDDLESVAYVLRQACAETLVVDALKALDRRATAHLTALDLVSDDDVDPPLLGAVSAAQPEAWWGTVWSD
jgi:CheY-like chemotaxis protein